MKIRFLFVCLVCGLCALAYSQTNPVLLRIQGREILKSEFERYLALQSKIDKDVDKEACFEEFVFDCLKITDASEAGWDKTPVFLQRQKSEVGRRMKARFVDCMRRDSSFCRQYASSRGRFVSGEWLKIRLIPIFLRQDAGKVAEGRALARLDSIYGALQSGVDFGRFAHGEAQWNLKRELPQEFQERLSALAVGEYTRPFISPTGAYILKLEGRKEWVDDGGVSLANAYAENRSLLQSRVSSEKLRAWSVENLEQTGAYQAVEKEVRDSLLVALWNRKNGIVADCEVDSVLLERFFNANKRKFGWNLPHFKGAVIRCANKKAASRIRKQLKRLPMEEWTEAIAQWNSAHADSPAQINCGLFRIGQNPYVDKLEFKCGELPEDANYAFTLGKRLGTTPDSYLDVYGSVKKEYLLNERMSLIESLKSRYRIEVDSDVLRSVVR